MRIEHSLLLYIFHSNFGISTKVDENLASLQIYEVDVTLAPHNVEF